MDTVPLTDSSGFEGRSASLPKAKDMSHHINQITKNRSPMALKELYRYASQPGMQAFAGGIPSPELFPFETLSAEIQRFDSLPLERPRVPTKPKKTLMEWLFGGNLQFTIPKYASDPTDPMAIQLATSLQYQAATGPPALPKFLREYVEKVYQPGYADWDVLVDVGATDGFGKAFNMLLTMGDAVLVEEWSYPGAMNAYMPFEVERVAVRMDGEGVRPDHLEDILANWDQRTEGRPRPRVFYTVPTGQNPTGATMWHQRKKEVYAICQKYDVVIIEDDPYFTLHCGEYHPPGKKLAPLVQRSIDEQKKEGKKGNQAFIDALPPSYLRFDTDGRVIRLDVSKSVVEHH
ncbi:hypothetical protein A1Q2_03037 [Trichosporon asahii var. asahii CBS 8904]|uniref:Aminotransferase class I/classII large domain-containing protein n=1 Tax=Trichosporon asahii var. asahii (strain CBS 8904) TaxID=1220162 RepID=K1VPT2_TRIAC|nr:hypothetical protein A1Q2_03037 [Trichosporon asahii var. asahii CBS 8904]